MSPKKVCAGLEVIHVKAIEITELYFRMVLFIML